MGGGGEGEEQRTEEGREGEDRLLILIRDEGIMIKDLDSAYIPSERKQKWVKIKPEYVEGLGDDLDMLIIGK